MPESGHFHAMSVLRCFKDPVESSTCKNRILNRKRTKKAAATRTPGIHPGTLCTHCTFSLLKMLGQGGYSCRNASIGLRFEAFHAG